MSVPRPKQNHANQSQSRIESKAQANSTVKPDSKHKKQKPKIWYKFKEEKKKHLPSFLRLHDDILWIIFGHFFNNVHMVDIKTTQRGTIQRRYGAQSLLFVCKDIRELATSAMFRYATFEIPHFKLHGKHLRENKMTTFHRIQNLVLLWTPAPAATFTTKRGDDAYILRNIDYLRSLEVWLLASQHLRIAHISDPGDMSRAELHETMLEKFEPSVRSQPKWLKRLLRDAPQRFEDVNISLVAFFAFGTIKDADLHAAHISWPSRSIVNTEVVRWADWARARTGLTSKAFRQLRRAISQGYFVSFPDLLPVRLRQDLFPHVGQRVFGRKVY